MEKSIVFPLQMTADGDGCIPLAVFKDVLDISQVVYYELTPKDENQLVLKFFDKDQKQIIPKE